MFWALLGTWVGCSLASFVVFEFADQAHHFHSPFIAHLETIPGELFVHLLVSPFAMHLAIPARFHRGNLYQWDPGWFSGTIPFAVYWLLVGFAMVAPFRSRRGVWWLLLLLILLGTAPRLGDPVYVVLTVT